MDFRKINENKEYDKNINYNFVISEDDKNFYNRNIHQFNRYIVNKFRFSTASTKSRSEISCTGAKAYKQKGTGNARRGRNSSNLRRGGYRAFGPTPRSFSFSLNKKLIKRMYSLMFFINANKITIIDNKLLLTKTKEVNKLFTDLNINNKTLLLTSSSDDNFILAYRNLNYIKIDDISYVSPESLTLHDNIIISENTFNKLKDKFL